MTSDRFAIGVGGGEWELLPCMWCRDPFHPYCNWNYMCVLAFNCCCNNYKFSGLKHTSVLSYSPWSQNSKMSFMGLKSSCWQGWLMEALEEDPFLPFSSTWGCLHSSARSPSFSIFKTNNRVSLNQCLSFSAFCFHCHISFSWFWSSYLPLIEAFVISLSPPG